MSINKLPATIQKQIKTKCSCGKEITKTVNFELIITKSDDYSDHRKVLDEYPHQSWTARYKSVNAYLAEEPKYGRNTDLEQAIKEAFKNLNNFTTDF